MPGGRPLKFKTTEELQEKIDAYFESCWEEREDEKTKKEYKFQVRPYTITGLAMHLDTSRQTLMNYEERGEFFDAIKRAKLKIENYTEEKLHGNNVTGVIFSLKNNYGWVDKKEIDNTHKGELTVKHVTDLTTEELQAILKG